MIAAFGFFLSAITHGEDHVLWLISLGKLWRRGHDQSAQQMRMNEVFVSSRTSFFIDFPFVLHLDSESFFPTSKGGKRAIEMWTKKGRKIIQVKCKKGGENGETV
jgi:hypothetical protein